MDKVLNCDILTPDGGIFTGPVNSVQVQGVEGRFEVLFNHAAIISTLASGPIILRTPEGDRRMEAGGGVIEVLKNKVIILVESVEGSEKVK